MTHGIEASEDHDDKEKRDERREKKEERRAKREERGEKREERRYPTRARQKFPNEAARKGPTLLLAMSPGVFFLAMPPPGGISGGFAR